MNVFGVYNAATHELVGTFRSRKKQSEITPRAGMYLFFHYRIGR